jgi:hypothetical protein
MAYIGKQPTVGNFVKLDSITTSATATYNLLNGGVAYSPQSANHCIVSLNGVIQSPTTSFTISGSTIVFASALTATDVIDFILVLGDVLNIGTPSDATVGFSKVTSNLITGATAETSIAGGDSILIYDDSATALRKMTRTNFVAGIGGTNTPIVYVKANAANITNVTTQKVAMNNEIIDTANAYDPTTNYRFTVPSGQGGKYYINFAAEIFETADSLNTTKALIYKNGASFAEGQQIDAGNNHAAMRPSVDAIVSLVATDYIEFYIYVNGTNDLSANTSATIFKLVE